MKQKSTAAASSALIVALGLIGQASVQQTPSCAQWQQQKLTAESCLCGEEVRRGGDRLKQCPDESSSKTPAGDMAAQAGGTSWPAQAEKAAAAGLPDAPSAVNFDSIARPSNAGVSIYIEPVVGDMSAPQAGSGLGKGGMVGIKVHRFTLAAGEVNFGPMVKTQVQVTPVTQSVTVGPGQTITLSGTATSVENPVINYREWVSGHFDLKRFWNNRIAVYAGGGFGQVTVPKTVAVKTTVVMQTPQGMPPIPPQVIDSVAPTGENNHLAGTIKPVGVEASFNKWATFDAAYDMIPEFAKKAFTVGWQIPLWSARTPDKSAAAEAGGASRPAAASDNLPDAPLPNAPSPAKDSRQLVVEGGCSFGNYKLFGTAENVKSCLADVEYDRKWKEFHNGLIRLDSVVEGFADHMTQNPDDNDWGITPPGSKARQTLYGAAGGWGFKVVMDRYNRIKPFWENVAAAEGFSGHPFSKAEPPFDFVWDGTAGADIKLGSSDKYEFQVKGGNMHRSNADIQKYNPGNDEAHVEAGLVINLGGSKKKKAHKTKWKI